VAGLRCDSLDVKQLYICKQYEFTSSTDRPILAYIQVCQTVIGLIGACYSNNFLVSNTSQNLDLTNTVGNNNSLLVPKSTTIKNHIHIIRLL